MASNEQYIGDSSGNSIDFSDLEDVGVDVMEWAERECDECGEEFETLIGLVAGYESLCPGCRPTSSADLDPPFIGAPISNGPLMEYGPHSEGTYDG